MHVVQLPASSDFEAWRVRARRLLTAGVSPEEVVWAEGLSLLTAGVAEDVVTEPETAGRREFVVPPRFVEAAQAAACFRDEGRWALLYRVLWRLVHGEPRLLEIVVDDDVYRLLSMEKAVRRDEHKMHAFVRFRKVAGDGGGDHYVAWHRPDHFILRRTAPWFRARFGVLRWTILTPDASVSWDGLGLRFGPGVPHSAAPGADRLEDLWRTYYASTFNPARVSMAAMRREMPFRHWPTLPETQIVPKLLKEAPARVEDMMKRQARRAPATAASSPASSPAAPAAAYQDYASCPVGSSAAEFIPKTTSLAQLRDAVNGCRGCPIYCNATHGVFGEGPKDATVVFVGEQPGDQEDRAGKPFVGPAGQVLDEALHAAGIPRDEAYVTNAVKHFKWEPRGTRRLHSKPSAREVNACRPWLETELSIVKPKMVVCLGATAAQSLMGPAFRITKQRGQVFPDTPWAPWLMATAHPSAILRIPEKDLRERAREEFIHDLKIAAKQLRAEKGK